MEDDEGDTSVAVEKSAVAGNTENQDGTGTTVLLKNTKAKKSSRSPLKGKDAVKSECGDSVKLCSNVETEPTACDIKSQNSNNKLANSSDVPKSPKKVNGEVELPKCDRVESTSGEDCISETTVAEGSKSLEIERTKPESEKVNNRKCKQKVRPVYEEMKNTGSNSDGNLEYKGFKKRILARTSASRKAVSQDTSQGSPRSVLKSKKLSVKKTVSESRHILVSHQKLPDGTQSSAQLTEYAQYLGLQPTVKFKCYKCGESGFPSMIKLQEHQYICLKNVNKMQSLLKPPVPQSSEPAPSTNFRITRKVYLCSACGTYYENWNLFLHMREVHKRHICLFCLGMFSQADKLATHLSGKHGVIEMLYNSLDHFEHEFKGSFFLMCCSCERIFTERENFFDHSCNEGLVINTDKGYCSLCGVRGAHFPTCRQAFTDNNSSPPPSSSVMGTSERPSESTQNSQPAIPERSLTVTKYLIPINKGSGKKTNQNQNVVLDNMGENQEKSRELSDIDDEYDISNAASFCHVNIHEPSDKQKSVIAPKVKTYKGKNQNVATKKVTEAKPPVTSPTGKVTSPNSKLSEGTVCLETCTQKKHEADKSTNIESDDATVGSKGPQERDQNSDIESNKISVPPDVCKESVELKTNEQDEKPESSRSDAEKTPDIQENHKRDSPVMEESDLHSENDMKQAEHETNLKSPLQREINTKLSPKSDNSLKTSPRTETKVGSKTPSATEADSESESSDSGEDTGESSSSTDISSEESEHHDGAEEKREEEKIYESDDNADSDKMSLIVDENRSDDDSESQKENIDDVEKDSKEDKISESEEIKKDEVRRDIDEMEQKIIESEENKLLEEEKVDEPTESVQVAGDDVPLLELTLEENLDTMNIQMLLKESVKVSCLNCVYCNHAKKIAVNGKQLALHLLAEHRFAPVVCSDSGELTEADGFVDKLKIALPELQQMFFNTDSYDNMDETCMHPYDRTYECFHCHFVTTLHKELYVHNRKMHQKTILLCIMCKSNFYSYSELLCHLCPGIYVPESNISFRCCLCTVDGLPSAFRLMVHLRKRHHACDVCLETTGDQQKLSNHVWKHKLHHLCYRCGIAYRNKPDITKHLFWKHGTESVLCKKCLQKKWPHVYHFCIPPNAFLCEDCNCSFSRAVALKVHKRLHADDLPYPCNECEERFISRKLLTKHQEKHREPPPEDSVEGKLEENDLVKESESHKEDVVHKAKIENVSHVEADALVSENANTNIPSKAEVQGSDTKLTASSSEPEAANVTAEPSVAGSSDEALKPEEKEVEEKKSKVVDVYDLPPLNLSSDSDDSDEDGEKKVQSTVKTDDLVSVADNANVNVTDKISETLSQTEEDNQQPVQVVDGIWDNFKTYKANLERRESQQVETGESSIQKSENVLEIQPYVRDTAEVISVINMDHDYCGLVVGTSYAAEMERQLENTSMTETETVQPTSQPQVETEKLEEAKEEREEESNVCGDDHNYCYTNTTSLCVEKEKENIVAAAAASTVPPTASTTKKKQKSPKKKQKRSASSSSSDSSSNSDSSTCSCGTNCSCSSSSSSSSGSSSSQSSDSDSSSSEGKRRQAARRERRRERAKKRKMEEIEDSAPILADSAEPTAPNGPPIQDDVPSVNTVAEPEEVELPIRESDLDTDETETDEDFYDKYPQRLANKLFAEKRNQLLLLAAVAPVNNGTMSQSGQSPPPSSVEEPIPKKKTKTKKHKKSQHQHSNMESKVESKLKLNIPTDYYSSQSPTFSKSSVPSSSTNNSANSAVLATPARTAQTPFHSSHPESSTPTASYQNTGSGSETDSKRLSKRKRVPKKFYGDSSDEEPDQPPVKWRKVMPATSNSPVTVTQTASSFTYKSSPVSMSEPIRSSSSPIPMNEDKSEEEAAEDSDSDREEVKKSSTESSNSESEGEKEHDDDDDDEPSDDESDVDASSTVQTNTLPSTRESDNIQQKNENLYCYCQCPYDEVSEMIACDGKDCTIEWFHFECVGIMVPPKGKWFCPDCRKRSATKSEFLVSV